MKVAVYTLTRDRLAYTQHNFALLQEKAGYPFHHFVIDNGSTDGSAEWLHEYADNFDNVHITNNEKNVGILKGSNQALDWIKEYGTFGLIAKIDNDCEILYDRILERIVRIYLNKPQFAGAHLFSPKVEGIVNQPKRLSYTMIDEAKIGLTAIVGGLFHTLEGEVYQKYRYNEDLPPASGQGDSDISEWVRRNGGRVGYIEDVPVAHYETTNGQAERYPEYFERKWKEEVERQ